MTIAEKIDSILQERHISRRKIAQKAGIPPSSLQSAMERGGDMPVSTLQKISKALEIDIYELLRTTRDQARKDIAFYNVAPDLYQWIGGSDEEGIQLRKEIAGYEKLLMHKAREIVESFGYETFANFPYNDDWNLILSINDEKRKIGLEGAKHIVKSFEISETAREAMYKMISQNIVMVSTEIDGQIWEKYESLKKDHTK